MYALKISISKLHLKHRPFRAVSIFAQGYQGGVNFGYFGRATTHPEGSVAEGAVIVDGEIACRMVVPGRPALMHVPGDPPGMRLRIQDLWGLHPDYASHYRMLIQAGPWLVWGGDIVTSYGNYPGVNPYASIERVALGLADPETVIVAVNTCTLPEMARWLREHGSMNAIAGDGGSSASLVVDGRAVFGGQLVPNALVWEDGATVLEWPQGTPGGAVDTVSGGEIVSRLVCLDPGHGGRDRANTGPTGYVEADGVLDIALTAGQVLRSHGIRVVYTRVEDKDLAGTPYSQTADLQGRCDVANRAGANLLVSIHTNASGGKGTETFHYPGSVVGRALAEAIRAAIVGELGTLSRRVDSANYYVLRNTAMPAALVEVAFHDNPEEEALLKRPEFRARAGYAIARGILDHLII